MRTAVICAAVLRAALAACGAEGGAVHPFEMDAEPVPAGPIDELVFGRLKALEITPARPCSDEVFIRRVHLDVIGTLPSPEEVRRFLRDGSPGKRAALVDALLARDEFADYWAMKWCDLLRVKAEFPINLWPNAAQAYHRWILASIRENLPYDRFARELLTSSGSNFRVPQVNFYRALQSREPESIASAVALTFMGARADKWPKDRLAGMAAFFSQVTYKSTGEWKEEIVTYDPSAAAAPPKAVFPDGAPAPLASGQDPREAFANWLISARNPWFARSIINRVWSWLLGRGIVHEPDDIRPDNPPSNPELLAYLERELLASGWDLKRLYRAILTSSAYALSPIPRSDRPEREANFSHYPLRRLDAEVLIDALCAITGTTEKYSSAIPEPFTFIPEEQRSISLADGSTSSTFLEMFGRPPRDTGQESERSCRPSAAQRLHMLNSSHIQRKIEGGSRIRTVIGSGKKDHEIIDEVYILILSRFPTEKEREVFAEYRKSGAASARDAWIDLVWALVNGSEFLHRH